MNREEVLDIIKKEGDYKEFRYRGIKCTIERHPSLKHLCGYIYTPKEVYEYDKTYDETDLRCHGGVTYASLSGEGYMKTGFDCGHAGDLVPGTLSLGGYILGDGEYRNMEYVESNIKYMVDQLNEKTEGLIDRLNIKNIREEKLKGLDEDG